MDALVDQYGRRIRYIRVSITDRCNLRCFYCAPGRAPDLLQRTELLSYEEMLRIIRVAATMGVVKVRVTGGEPLVRRNVSDFVGNVLRIPGIADVSVTTNGVLLKEMAGPLFAAGLRRINVSLDTLHASKFKTITGLDLHHAVREGIAHAEEVGLCPIKINVVVMRGFNDDDVEDLAGLTLAKPYSVRFIECMPIGNGTRLHKTVFVSVAEIRSRLELHGPLIPVQSGGLDGPAQRFRYPSGKGEIGLIGAVSSHFCGSCNRLRLTPDGKLRPCLFSEGELDVKDVLRRHGSDSELADLLLRAAAAKPKSRDANNRGCRINPRGMSAIGG
ncbi:MAG: GTP 3',8-cyclase MoaA [Thermodesulfobacteriota bacterium]